MQDNDFYRIMRTKLSEWQEPLQAADWEDMDQMLDVTMDTAFDAAFKTKLAAAVVPDDTIDWDGMSQILDAPVDAAFRSKLKTATVAYEPADWRLMAGMLGLPFDRVVGEKLRAAEVTIVSGDWAEMEEKFAAQADGALREKLAAHAAGTAEQTRDWKVMAAYLQGVMPVATSYKWVIRTAVLALLLLLVWVGVNTGKEQPQALKTEAEISVQDVEKISRPKVAATPAPQTTKPQAKLAVTTVGKPLSLKGSKLAKIAQAQTSGTFSENALAIPENIEASGESVLVKPKSKEATGEYTLVNPEKASPQAQDFSSKIHEEETKVALEVQKPKYLIQKLNPKSSTPLLATHSADVNIKTTTSQASSFVSAKVGYVAALFSNTTRFNDPGKLGYTSGLRLELGLSSKLSLITGLVYADRRYEREIFNTAIADPMGNPGSRAGLSPYWTSKIKAHYQLIEIPVLVRVQLKEGKKFGLYLQAGLNTMFSIQERYLDYDPRSASNISATIANPSSALELDKLKPSAHQRSINTYTGNLQFAPGVTYNVGKHWQLQLEPFLQLGLQPTGLKQVPMHSAGLLAAWMYRF